MDLALTINKLSSVFGKQLEIYKQLTRLVSSLSADIACTKGNMSGLTSKFEQENDMIEEIAKLKEDAQSDILIWQENKHHANEYDAKKLDNVFKEVQDEIMRFLNADKILKKQVDFYRTKNGTR
jgi:hypothetical protein